MISKSNCRQENYVPWKPQKKNQTAWCLWGWGVYPFFVNDFMIQRLSHEKIIIGEFHGFAEDFHACNINMKYTKIYSILLCKSTDWFLCYGNIGR